MEKGREEEEDDGAFIVQEEEAFVRCKRSDGKRWRCKAPAMRGYNLCERHHHQNCRRKKPSSTSQNNDSSHENPNNLMAWLDNYRLPNEDAYTNIKEWREEEEQEEKKKGNTIYENQQDENVEPEKNEGDPEPQIIMEKEEEEDMSSSNKMRMQIMEMKDELNTLREWVTQSIPALFATVKDIINALPNSEEALEKFNRSAKRSKLMAHVQGAGTSAEKAAPDA